MGLTEVISTLFSGFSNFGLNDVADILVIFILMYRLITWTKETRAYGVLKGIAFLFVCLVASEWLQLNTISWVLGSILTSGSIFIILFILFQPEIRRVLERIGRSGPRLRSLASESEREELVRDLTRTLLRLSKRRVGALLVFEQTTGLADIISTGVRIDGLLSGALIENIFEPNTPLHDGAVVIHDDNIIAASCLLPISDDYDVSRELGTRHRAALGVSAVADCVVIVVSEESGAISMARDGKLVRWLDERALNNLLEGVFTKQGLGGRGRKRGKKA